MSLSMAFTDTSPNNNRCHSAKLSEDDGSGGFDLDLKYDLRCFDIAVMG